MSNGETPEKDLKAAVEAEGQADTRRTGTLTVEEPEPPNTHEEAKPSPDPRGEPVTLSFVDMLVRAGMLAAEQASVAQESARREKLPLWRILVRDGQ